MTNSQMTLSCWPGAQTGSPFDGDDKAIEISSGLSKNERRMYRIPATALSRRILNG